MPVNQIIGLTATARCIPKLFNPARTISNVIIITDLTLEAFNT